MPEEKKFEKLELIEILNKASKVLDNRIKGYLIGGLAMIFHGNKIATKDVDLVFDSKKDAISFEKAISKIGFMKVDDLSFEYLDMETRNIFQSPYGYRFDIFVKLICNCLTLSKDIKKRAKEVFHSEKLTLLAISLEDIFLFKGITSRPDDLADMANITSAGLDWKLIEQELRSQPKYWKWLPRYYMRLQELESEYGITSPSISELENDAEISVGIGLLLDHLENEPISLEDAVKILDEKDSSFTVQVLNRMKKIKIIREVDGLFILKNKL